MGISKFWEVTCDKWLFVLRLPDACNAPKAIVLDRGWRKFNGTKWMCPPCAALTKKLSQKSAP